VVLEEEEKAWRKVPELGVAGPECWMEMEPGPDWGAATAASPQVLARDLAEAEAAAASPKATELGREKVEAVSLTEKALNLEGVAAGCAQATERADLQTLM
jgi:hypothetical protein